MERFSPIRLVSDGSLGFLSWRTLLVSDLILFTSICRRGALIKKRITTKDK